MITIRTTIISSPMQKIMSHHTITVIVRVMNSLWGKPIRKLQFTRMIEGCKTEIEMEISHRWQKMIITITGSRAMTTKKLIISL
jgi:hypothetical protein